MTDPVGLRLAEVQAWLIDQGLVCSEPTPLVATLLAGGRSNVSYLLQDAAGTRIVLRRPPLGHVLPSAHDMSREFRVLSGLNRVAFPAPVALANCVDEAVNGSPFMAMSYVDGRVISDATTAGVLTPSEASDVSASLVETLASLHRIDVPATGLAELGRPAGYLPRQVRRWGQQWELTKTRDLPAIDELRDWLMGAVDALPIDLPSSIVHGDYRLDNVILDGRDPRVIAVLDWEMSTLGDPVADLAIALVYWTEPGDGRRRLIPVADDVTSGPGFWSRAQLVEGYAARTGLALEHLDVCTALACFKLSVIMESIHHRFLDGQQLGTAAEGAAGMDVAAQALADLGLAVSRLGALEGLSS